MRSRSTEFGPSIAPVAAITAFSCGPRRAWPRRSPSQSRQKQLDRLCRRHGFPTVLPRAIGTSTNHKRLIPAAWIVAAPSVPLAKTGERREGWLGADEMVTFAPGVARARALPWQG